MKGPVVSGSRQCRVRRPEEGKGNSQRMAAPPSLRSTMTTGVPLPARPKVAGIATAIRSEERRRMFPDQAAEPRHESRYSALPRYLNRGEDASGPEPHSRLR